MVTKKKTQMRGRGQGGIATTLTAKQRKILRKYGPYRLDDDGEIRDSNDMVLWSIVPGVMDVDHALVAALNAAIEEPEPVALARVKLLRAALDYAAKVEAARGRK